MIRNRFDGFVVESGLTEMTGKKSVGKSAKRNSEETNLTLSDLWQANVSLQFGRIFDSTFTGQGASGPNESATQPTSTMVKTRLADLFGKTPAGVDLGKKIETKQLPQLELTNSAKRLIPEAPKTAPIVRPDYTTGDGSEYLALANLIGGDVSGLVEAIRQLQFTQSARSTFKPVAAVQNPNVEDVILSRDFDMNVPQLNVGAGGGGAPANNFPPRVTLTGKSIEVGNSFLISEIFTYSDIDNNPITALRIIDRSASTESGYLWYRGQRISANQWLEVPASQVQFLRFFGGVIPTIDTIAMQVYDGKFWSTQAFADINTIRANLFPPTAQGFNGQVLAFESVKIRDFIRATDPENDIRTLRFIDRQNNVNSGFFSINGVQQEQGKWFEIAVNQLDSVNYHGGRNGQAEFVGFQAWDGRFWSNIGNFTMQTIPNIARPVVSAPDVVLKSGQVIQVSNWITYSDADGNTAKRYRFYDTGNSATGGYFSLNGIRQAANAWFEVEAKDLNKLNYHASEFADFERFRVNVFDGLHWSDISTGSVTVRVKPITTLPDLILLEEQENVFLRDIMQVNGNGLTVKTVQMFVPNSPPGGPLVRLNGQALAENRFYEMTWQDFQNVTYVGGAGGDSVGRYFNDLLLRFNNGVAWSEWERIDTVTEIIGNDALFTGTSWSAIPGQAVEITYSFPLVVPFYYADDADERNELVRALNGVQQQRMRDALAIYSEFANITFREVPESVGGMMRFMFTEMDDGTLGWAYFPSAQRPSQSTHGDVWFNSATLGTSNFEDGTEAWLTAIHEIGHAVGFGHPFTTPGETGPQLPSATNNHLYTEMSYNRTWQVPGVRNGTASDGNPYGIDTPMLYDIMELQRLYGATASQNSGSTTYSWPNAPFRETIRDTDGFDTLDASNFGVDQSIDLRPGRFNNIGENSHSVMITHDTRIENALGGRGADRIIGNELNNLLVGNGGNDILEGRGGTNLLMGGAGNDTYIWRLGDVWSTIDENRSTGRDEIHVFGNHSTQNAGFGTINDLTEDFIFRRIGRDLRIDFTINRGEAVGGLTVKDMEWGGSRVETLRIFGLAGQIGPAINLESIFVQATDVAQRFRLTETEHPFGFIAVPA
ncbi:MAG: M10 family metallopeptidase [Planctomycetaceae bacterium]|nr:M10 family metallopeptidase [Planctomycetaceae bacterium]